VTPEQIEAVQRSYRELVASRAEIAATFYRRLFEANPELRTLFPEDLAELRVKFTAQLGEIVASIDHLDELLERTEALGGRHAGYGVRAADYDRVGSALVGALEEVTTRSGGTWTPELGVAWRVAYGLVAQGMQQGAATRRR
jgi:nitric oxide dioxygenase